MERACLLLREEAGTESVEVALVLPVYFLTFFVMFSFIIALFGYSSAVMAARMGVRYASMHSTTSLAPCSATTVQTMVNSMLMAPMASATAVNTAWSAGNTIGSTVTVTVKLTYGVMPYGFLSNFAPVVSAQGVVVH